MRTLRTLQFAVLAFSAIATVLYGMFMGGASLALNTFLRFNPDGHHWDARNDTFILVVVFGTLAIVLALEAARSLLRSRNL